MPNLGGYRDFNSSPHCRVSVSSSGSSASNRDSVFSTTSTRTTASSSSNQSTDSKFWCTSCEKTFKRKFDWKRHLEEFHERWRKYPCPDCNQSFWGPNTFNQHHKGAHGCQTCPHAESVVKYTRKRKAWGCGFCAALHRQFEKHIDHVAAHFDTGSTKADWLHSNVIYGLLHQDPVHELWKHQLAENQHLFQGHQPHFSWIPETTGRAQGYAENESPGQLQDLLEFFDGSKDAAERVVRVAWRTMQVLLQPKGCSPAQSLLPHRSHSTASNLHKHVSIASPSPIRGLMSRRTMSNVAYPGPKRADTRSASISTTPPFTPATVPETMYVQSPPLQQHGGGSPFQGFVHQQPPQSQVHNRTPSLDKELPPVPLATDMAMDLDMSIFGDAPGALLMPPGIGGSDDWTSRANTLVNGDSMPNPLAPHQHFPATAWPDLNMFGTANPEPPTDFR